MDEDSDYKANEHDFSKLESDVPKNDISTTRVRYYMLALACFLCFGNYFVYDNPSILQTQIQDVIII